jgi:hypothetical protein
MCWVISTIWGLILLWELIKWFFAVALPWFFGHLGEFVEWTRDQITRFISWTATTWRTMTSGGVASPGREGDASLAADKSLLESQKSSGLNESSKTSPSDTMWPFGSIDPQREASPTPQAVTPNLSVPKQNNSLNVLQELAKAKADLSKAQAQVKSLEDAFQKLKQVNVILNKEYEQSQLMNVELGRCIQLMENDIKAFQDRYDSVSAELAELKPFAAVKTEQRRMIYTVSPELHKKWQSIMRDTTRLQVLELLGQPTEILAVSHGGAAPIQLVRKGVPAPRPELLQHVTNLVVGDGLLKDWVRGVGRTAWVYADDTLAPGVIFFASESDGGQVFRIFPPEC